jgi:hypothetical protein
MRFSSFYLSLCVVLQLTACSANDGAKSPTGMNENPAEGDGDGDGDDEDEDDGEEDEDGSDGPDNGPCETPADNVDVDKDGFTKGTGDCNECSPQINPGAYDFPGNEFDEDCSGTNAVAAEDECDQGLMMASTDAQDAARAIGLCKFTTMNEKGWGVISARFTNATGDGELHDPRMVGLLPDFGAAKPRAGGAMLALSSGIARAPGQQGYTSACDPDPAAAFEIPCVFPGFPPGCVEPDPNKFEPEGGFGGMPPPGYPKESPGCESALGENTVIYNQAALEVQIRVPTNAKSYAFDSIFYTYEYPEFICSEYNDFFVVFQSPKPADLSDENIVFDMMGGPIGVNSGLLAVCNPDDQLESSAKQFECSQRTALLAGTGFGAGESICGDAPPEDPEAPPPPPDNIGGASTGWLHTTAPVAPNTIITVRFAVWDTLDQILDSTVLVDKWQWSVEEPEVVTTPVIL